MRLIEFNNKQGNYAGVNFDKATVDAVKKHQQELNIPNPLDESEFHSTVMYNRNYIEDFESLGKINPPWVGKFTGYTIFPSGDDNALVLLYDCPELTKRWNTIMNEYNATWDHEGFNPHITLSYDVGDIDINDLPPYTGPINIIEEYAEDLNLDWQDEHK